MAPLERVLDTCWLSLAVHDAQSGAREFITRSPRANRDARERASGCVSARTMPKRALEQAAAAAPQVVRRQVGRREVDKCLCFFKFS